MATPRCNKFRPIHCFCIFFRPQGYLVGDCNGKEGIRAPHHKKIYMYSIYIVDHNSIHIHKLGRTHTGRHNHMPIFIVNIVYIIIIIISFIMNITQSPSSSSCTAVTPSSPLSSLNMSHNMGQSSSWTLENKHFNLQHQPALPSGLDKLYWGKIHT